MKGIPLTQVMQHFTYATFDHKTHGSHHGENIRHETGWLSERLAQAWVTLCQPLPACCPNFLRSWLRTQRVDRAVFEAFPSGGPTLLGRQSGWLRHVFGFEQWRYVMHSRVDESTWIESKVEVASSHIEHPERNKCGHCLSFSQSPSVLKCWFWPIWLWLEDLKYQSIQTTQWF